MTTPNVNRRVITVRLLDATYEVDLDNKVHKAFATVANDVDSAHRRLEVELNRVKTDAERALTQLRNGHSPNPLGPIQSENLIASYAAEYHAKAAHARDLLRLADLHPINTATERTATP